MQKWEIQYYTKPNGNAPVKDSIDRLSLKKKARVYKTLELVENYGLNVGEPHIKHIESELWELRVRSREGAIRLLFTIKGRKVIILLHGFYKKTNKIRETDLNIARARKSELL